MGENILALLDDILIGGKNIEDMKRAKAEALAIFKLGIITYAQYIRIIRVINAN